MKKFILLILLFLMFIPFAVDAEIPHNEILIRTYDDVEFTDEEIMGAAIFNNGDFVAVGNYYSYYDGRTNLGSFENDYSGNVMYYDKSGKLIWETIIDENCYELYDVEITPDEDIVVIGAGFLAKLSKNGTILWKKIVSDLFEIIVVDKSGNIYTADNTNYYKYNSNGELLSSKEHDTGYARNVIITSDDNVMFLLSREFRNGRGFNSEVFLDKVSPDFNTLWTANVQPNIINENDSNWHIPLYVSEVNGNFVVVGQTYHREYDGIPTNGEDDGFITLFDKDGNKKWSRVYGNQYHNAMTVVGTINNQTILAFGEYQDDQLNQDKVFMLEYSLDGELIDEQEYLKTKLKSGNISGGVAAFGGVISPKNGLVLGGWTSLRSVDQDPETDDHHNSYVYLIHNTYATKYLIRTKTDGNGTIEVIDSASGGDSIQFKVSAKKGFKLSRLIITTDSDEKVEFSEENITTDSSGVLSVSTNKFTMPFENVTIEARWSSSVNVPDTLINPNTGTEISIIIIFILIISSITYMVFKRKKNYIMK